MTQPSVPPDFAGRKRLPAKLSKRRMSGVIDRERLFTRLDAEGERPLLWITGPAGAGKTTLVSTWLARSANPAVWYRVDAGDGDSATVFSHLALAADAHSRKRRLELPALTPEYLLDLPGFARRWFGLFFAALPARCALIFDSLEAAPGDALTTLLAWALEELLPGQRMVVTSREAPPPALLHLLARGELATLTWEDLRLTADEALAIAQPTLPQANADETRRLNLLCDGWAAGYVLMLNVRRRGGTLAAAPAVPAALGGHELTEQLFPYYLNELFEGAGPAVQRLLMHSALLPAFSAADAAVLAPGDDASALLQTLYRRHFFIERNGDSPPLYRYHALFREFLLQQAEVRLGAELCLSLRRQAAALLQAQGRTEEALQLWTQTQAWDEASALILTLAPALLVQGRYASLAQAIDAMPAAVTAANAWLSFWRGMAVLPMSPPQARVSLEAAFDVFDRAGDRIGCLMACSAILESCMLEWADLRPTDRWGEVLRGLLAQAGEIPLEVEVRALASTIVLFFRGTMYDVVDMARARAMALLPRLTDPQLRLAAASLCALMHNVNGEWSAGARFIAEVEASLQLDRVPPLQTVMWKAIATHVLWDGHFEQALAHVDEARALAQAFNVRVFEVSTEGQGVLAALNFGDIRRAEEHHARQRQHQCQAVQSGRLLDVANLEYLAGQIMLARGDVAQAFEVLRQAVERTLACGAELQACVIRTAYAHALIEMHEFDAANEQMSLLIEFARRSKQVVFEHSAHMNLAWSFSRSGRPSEALRELSIALPIGRTYRYRTVFPLVPVAMLQELAMLAFSADIEVDYVRELLRVRRVPPPSPDADVDDHWPWPIRITLLGAFTLLLDDAPMRPPAKAPKKPLELLKLLAAFGGDGLPLATIEQHLWPDLDGAAARNACSVALHRLRKLLGDDEALLLHEGRLSLNPNKVWTDVASFQRQADSVVDSFIPKSDDALAGSDGAQRLLSTYRGHLLPEHDAHWTQAPRERLRSRFLRACSACAASLERAGQFEPAVALSRRVIEIDPAAEALHQSLMRCLLALGRRAEALDAWRRCSEQLYHERGARPSAQTLALRERIEAG